MAIEVVYNVADEWLEELAEDARDGLVDRGLVRVTVQRDGPSSSPLALILIQASYSVRGAAVRLQQRIGWRPVDGALGDPDGIGEAANEAADRLRVQAAELGLAVRAGRLVTV